MVTSRFLVLVVLLLGGIGAILSPNPLLVAACGVVLAGAVTLLWTPRDVPVLLLPIGMQWLSVSIKPLETAARGIELNQLAERGANLEPAAWFGLAGIAALAVGMRLGSGRRLGNVQQRLLHEARQWPGSRVVVASLGAIGGGHLADLMAAYVGRLGQLFLAVSDIRLAGIFFLAFWCVATNRRLGLLAAVVVVETALGMTGFFSDFKFVVFTFALGAACARPRVSVAVLCLSALVIAVIIGLGVFWSAVKPQYRTFLNAGSGQQIVVRSIEERFDYLTNAFSDFEVEEFNDGLRILVDRLSYIDFLAHTMAYVPSVRPYGDGERLLAAAQHVLMPRIFFPNKPPLPNDTVVTAEYTGLTFTDTVNTSISIGYLGELYTDFGVVGATLVTVCFGWLMGRAVAVILSYRKLPLILSLSLSAVALFPALLFERALVKLVGSMLTTFIATLLIQRIVAPRVLRIAFGRRLFRGPRRPALGR